MSKWEMVKLSEITELITKGTTPTTLGFSFQEEGINFVKIESITQSGEFIQDKFEHISFECDEKLKRSRLQEQDILFSIAGALGRTAIVKREILPANTNQALSIIRLNRKNILPKYIQISLKSDAIYQQFQKQKQGVAQLNLSLKNIGDLEIPLPPIETQKQIAKTLDTAAEMLVMCNQQLAELDNLIKSTFYDMFGDPIANKKGWEVILVSDCLRVIGGYAFKSTDFLDEGIPVIKIGNINSGVFHDNGISYWKYDNKLDKYLLHPNDIVISLTGTVGKDDYANVCILPNKYHDYYLNQRNAKLELNENINVYYLLHILKDSKIKGQLTGISRGIRQANISNSDILSLCIPLPPISLQTQFAAIVTKIEEQKALVQKAINETQYLFDSLMSEYFE